MKTPADWLLEKRRTNHVELLQVTVWEADVSWERQTFVDVLKYKSRAAKKVWVHEGHEDHEAHEDHEDHEDHEVHEDLQTCGSFKHE